MKLSDMTNDQLLAHLETEAARYHVIIEAGAFNSVDLVAVDGKRFDTDLHCLVNAPGDNGNYRACLFSALRDLHENGPRVHDCPEDCACKE